MKQVKQCPSFSVIRSASDGDETAIEKILNHYNAYISKACLRPFYDEYGNMQLAMLKQLLDKQLITDKEYAIIKARLMKDYKVVSDITT